MISDDSKYIVFDNGLNDVPIVFPNFIEHSVIAASFPNWKPISAGFVTPARDEQVVAHGGSTSLNLKSKKIDSILLSKLIQGKNARFS